MALTVQSVNAYARAQGTLASADNADPGAFDGTRHRSDRFTRLSGGHQQARSATATPLGGGLEVPNASPTRRPRDLLSASDRRFMLADIDSHRPLGERVTGLQLARGSGAGEQTLRVRTADGTTRNVALQVPHGFRISISDRALILTRTDNGLFRPPDSTDRAGSLERVVLRPAIIGGRVDFHARAGSYETGFSDLSAYLRQQT